MNSRSLPNCDISLGSLTLPAPESGDFVKLILLYIQLQMSFKLLNVSERQQVFHGSQFSLNYGNRSSITF